LAAFFIGGIMKPEINISVSELSHLIDEWIFSERDRKILKRRLIDGITYERIAEEFDMSPRQISNIIYKGTQKIAPKLPSDCQKDAMEFHNNCILASC
jgi:DNA-directed RNA polymerase specialized sigma subunit